MKNIKYKLNRFLASDWFAAACLLAIFFAIKGYKYGWDDQHLEIPMLKSLIDSTFYQGDYYVETLKLNFISFFYRILARLITVEQIPATYFSLFIISRYFLFFWMYKIWKLISRRPVVAYLCTLSFIYSNWVPEFFYRTFSHQEFALAMIFAGIYFFYKERFLLASFIFGISANIHALYSAFPMAYLGAYLILNYKKRNIKTSLKSIAAFIAGALPIILLSIKWQTQGPGIKDVNVATDWLVLHRIASPQNFIFNGIRLGYLFKNITLWVKEWSKYILAASLFLLNYAHNKKFKPDNKAKAIILTAIIFLVITYIFTYIKPHRFIVDLNLIRNMQFLFFVLHGYTVILLVKLIEKEKISTAILAAVMLCFLPLNSLIVALFALSLALFIFIEKHIYNPQKTTGNTVFTAAAFLGFAACLITIIMYVKTYPVWLYWAIIRFTILIFSIGLVIQFLRIKRVSPITLRQLLILIPLIITLISYCIYHSRGVKNEKEGEGFWKLQRDWEEAQRFVRDNTPKDSLLLVPYDMEMGGFRIFSERKIICSYRDCGLIGFDYNAALEWARRVRDIEPFKVRITSSIKPAVLAAIAKYKVDYILFMRYYAPRHYSTKHLRKIFANDSFALFKVLKSN